LLGGAAVAWPLAARAAARDVFAARDVQLPPPDLSSPSFKGDAGAKFCKPPTPVGTL
jgi:hypothetical protein